MEINLYIKYSTYIKNVLNNKFYLPLRTNFICLDLLQIKT